MIVRALIGALSKDEIAAQQRAADLSRALTAHRTRLERLDWQIERLHDDLSATLRLGDLSPGTPIASHTFNEAAQNAFGKVLKLPADGATTKMQVARADRAKPHGEFQLRRAGLTAHQAAVASSATAPSAVRLR